MAGRSPAASTLAAGDPLSCRSPACSNARSAVRWWLRVSAAAPAANSMMPIANATSSLCRRTAASALSTGRRLPEPSGYLQRAHEVVGKGLGDGDLRLLHRIDRMGETQGARVQERPVEPD